MSKYIQNLRVFAIDVFSRGYGYVAMEGEKRLVDWGIKSVCQSGDAAVLQHIARHVDLYQPDVVVVENYLAETSRKGARAKGLLQNIQKILSECQLPMCLYEVHSVKDAVCNDAKASKYTVAVALAKEIPELYAHLPPVRKPWMSEDARINLFDAAALAVTFYRNKRPGFRSTGKPVRYTINTTCQNIVQKYLQ